MRFLHTADLHIGKRVNEFSMLEDQEYILRQILKTADKEQVEAVLIAGDVYDKQVPSAEAVRLFDWFLTQLNSRKLPVFVIGGNHDSVERLSFGAQIMEESGVYLTQSYDGKVVPVRLEDEYGPVNLWMLPFLKPAMVKRFFPEQEIVTYQDALETVIGNMELNREERNLLIAHQFVTGAVTGGSEDSVEVFVGGVENVDASVFADFDYVALGHIHRAQSAGGEQIRYSGTPLKYSFSEIRHEKSVTIAELKEKGSLTVHQEPLKPLHDMREIRGSYEELVLRENYQGTNLEDYLHVILTDENDIPDVIGRLRSIYPNIMKLDYDNQRTRRNQELMKEEAAMEQSPMELLGQFFLQQNNQEMSPEQTEYARTLMETIRKEEGVE
ncbi:MAG: exonuclease SbcCD subunit D [Lachnospiraceae bacterium]|nr:exonuclease SbcCD subunit D [Lachnospiraceae bacterium]